MREFHLKTPEESTRQRMIEVQFYLIIQQLQKQLSDTIYFDNIIENLCMLYQVKYTNISFAITNLQTMEGKPGKIDLALAHKYLKIPMRKLVKIGHTSPNVIYKNLTDYINSGSPDLSPRLGERVLIEMENFIINFSKTFKNLDPIIKLEDDIHDKYRRV